MRISGAGNQFVPAAVDLKCFSEISVCDGDPVRQQLRVQV